MKSCYEISEKPSFDAIPFTVMEEIAARFEGWVYVILNLDMPRNEILDAIDAGTAQETWRAR